MSSALPQSAALSPQWPQFLVAEVGGSSEVRYDHHELLNAFNAGHVTPSSLIFRPDVTSNQWLPLQSIPALTHELGIPFVPLLTSAENGHSGATDDWFYVDNDGRTVRAGSWAALQDARNAGQLSVDSIVWRAGMQAWKKLSEVPDPPAPFVSRSAPARLQPGPHVLEAKAQVIGDDGDNEEDDADARERSAEASAGGTGNKRKRKKRKKAGAAANSSIYVTGLPEDLGEAEAVEFFKKAGVLQEDALTGEKRIRLHQDEEGHRKGDATVTYLFPDSIHLAVTLLDGAEIKPGFPVHLTEATFSQAASTTSRPPPKKSKVELTLAKRRRETALSWVGDDSSFHSPMPQADAPSSVPGLRIVVLKRVFSPEEVAGSGDAEAFFDELSSDIGEELERVCGEVEKMTAYEESEDGVVIVKFRAAEGAERCVERMKGRWYGGRQLTVEWFDGTDYSKKESEEEQKRRMEKFGEELERGATGHG